MTDHENQYAETAGDPGAAVDLPVTSGRDVTTGEPDRPIEETQ